MIDNLILRMKNEITNLKQVRQRSSASVATITKSVTLTMTGTSIVVAECWVRLKNLSEIPMLVEVVGDFDNFTQKFGAGLYGVVGQNSIDKIHPLDRLMNIRIVSPTASISVGQKFTANFSFTATSDFTVEVLS